MNWNKIKTWIRIKKRVVTFYLVHWVLSFDRPLKLLFNMAFILTIPLWVGFAYWVMFATRAMTSKKYAERSVVTGKIWAWEMFKRY